MNENNNKTITLDFSVGTNWLTKREMWADLGGNDFYTTVLSTWRPTADQGAKLINKQQNGGQGGKGRRGSENGSYYFNRQSLKGECP